MEFLLQHVNLLCVDLKKQSSFISFLFDVEIHFDKNLHYFLLGGTRFNLIQGYTASKGALAHFELRVQGAGDLNHFKQKFELYVYKTQSSELKTSFNQSSFEFEDPSGNLWKINSPNERIILPSRDATLM
ncbi:MAG: hypothetical protein WEB87_03975 [Bacteriovoracaceae bacterium]